MKKELERSGLTKKEVNILLSMSNPNSKDNPWDYRAIRVMNELILALLLVLGLRVEEILTLQTKNINTTSEKPFIRIISRFSTRDVPIPNQLFRMLSNYLNEVRNRFPSGEKNDCLFVSESGRPLSRKYFNKIFADLMDRVPGLWITACRCRLFAVTTCFERALQQRDMNYSKLVELIQPRPSQMLSHYLMSFSSQFVSDKVIPEAENRGGDE